MAAIPKYTPTDYSKAYMDAAAANALAQEKIYQNALAAAETEKAKIKNNYDDIRARDSAAARMTALGSNEELASKGLAGGAYAAPRSGASESSRVTGDIALQNNLNAAYRSQAEQIQAQNVRAQEAESTKEGNIATYNANAALDLAKAKAEEQKTMADYAFNAWQADQAAQEFAQKLNYTKQQDALDNALRELELFGKVMTSAAAKALGVKIGTTSFAYNQAKKQRKV